MAAVGAIAAAAALAVSAAASALTITELPTPGGGAASVAVGPDGSVWYGGVASARSLDRVSEQVIGRYNPATNEFREWPVPGRVRQLVPTPDGRVWLQLFRLPDDQGRPPSPAVFDPATGSTVGVAIPGLKGVASHITVAPDGGVWVLGSGIPLQVVRIDPRTLAQRTFEPKGPNGKPLTGAGGYGPAAWGPGNALTLSVEGVAFGDYTTRPYMLARLDPSSGATTLTEVPLTEERYGGQTQPCPIYMLGPSAFGATWGAPGGTGACSDLIVRFTPGVGWSSWRVGTDVSNASDDPFSLAALPDGSVWAGTSGGLARLDPQSGATEVWAIPTATGKVSFVASLAVGPDGTLWLGRDENLARVDPAATGPDVGNMRSALSHGLATYANCAASCSGTVQAVLLRSGQAAATATGRTARGRVVARRRVRLKAGGRRAVTLRFAHRAKRKIRRSGRVARVSVRVRVRDGRTVRRATRIVLLRRYATPRHR